MRERERERERESGQLIQIDSTHSAEPGGSAKAGGPKRAAGGESGGQPGGAAARVSPDAYPEAGRPTHAGRDSDRRRGARARRDVSAGAAGAAAGGARGGRRGHRSARLARAARARAARPAAAGGRDRGRRAARTQPHSAAPTGQLGHVARRADPHHQREPLQRHADCQPDRCARTSTSTGLSAANTECTRAS